MIAEWTFQGAWRISSLIDGTLRSVLYFEDTKEEALLAYVLDHEDTDSFEEGEVVGLDMDGCVIQWNANEAETYNSGETLDQFGRGNLRDRERERLGLP